MKMTCSKCGKDCERMSNRQKYCSVCSPDVSTGKQYKTIICKTCGKEVQNAYYKTLYCRSCTNTPYEQHVICKRCKKDMGTVISKSKTQLTDTCFNCEEIIQRKDKAYWIMRERKHKKVWSRFGRYLLEKQERENKESLEKGKEPERYFTQSRYVSEKEIKETLDKIATRQEQNKCIQHIDFRKLGIPVWGTRVQSPVLLYYISDAGFYRVEKKISSLYYNVGYWCERNGIPDNQTGIFRIFHNEYIHDGYDFSNKRFQARMKKKRMEERKKTFLEATNRKKRDAQQFFNTLAMAGAIAQSK